MGRVVWIAERTRALGHRLSPKLWLLFFVLACSAQAPAHATEPQQYDFALPAQPLKQALSAWSEIVQQPILFNPRHLEGLQAPALHGNLSAQDAIRRLLGEAPFNAEPNEPHGWLIKPNAIERVLPAEPQQSFIDEVLVLGHYSGNLSEAIAAKRDASHRQDVIFAEDVADFPALNIAEALNRSPGVSVIRDRGEALFISIRGLPPQFNSLTLNGQPVATHENMRTSEQFGRRFHYDTLPAELVARVEVNKSTTAAQEEGSIGGQVNIRTFRPLDLDAKALALSLTASHSDLADETSPRASALASWTNQDGTFGALLAGTYSQRQLRQDRALNFRWYPLNDPDALPGAPETAISPSSVRPTLELEDRRLRGLSAAVQWLPNAGQEIAINVLSLRQDADYREFSYSADYDPATLLPNSLEWRDYALVGGTAEEGSVQIGYESAGFTHVLQAADATVSHSLGPWRYAVNLAASTATSDNSDPIRRTRLRREDDVKFSFSYPRAGRDAVPSVTYQNLSLLDPAAFPGRRLEFRVMKSKSERLSAGASVGRVIERAGIDQFEMGINTNSNRHRYRRRDTLITDQIAGVYFPADFFTQLPVKNFLDEASGKLPIEWLVPEEKAFWRNVDIENLMEGQESDQDRLNSYDISERISAATMQLDFSHGRLVGNGGIRYVYTTQDSAGYQLKSASAQADASAALLLPPSTGTVAIPTKAGQTYAHWLPALNLSYELDANLLWRLGTGKVINRPELQDLASRLTLNSGDAKEATGGNPHLKPVKAWQFDTALEWYFAKRSLLSVGTFHTELHGFVQSATTDTLIGGEQYQVTSPSNGAQAKVTGLEVDYQHLFQRSSGHHWGIQANATWMDSSARYRTPDGLLKDKLADVAGTTLNLSAFYEANWWDARINYSWRGDILKEVGTHTMAAQNSSAFGTWDAQAALHFADHWRLTLEGINITGEAEQEFVSSGEFAGYSYYGRTLMVGLKFSL